MNGLHSAQFPAPSNGERSSKVEMELLRSVASDFRTYTTFKGDRWSGTQEYDITLRQSRHRFQTKQ